jgi:SIR2-like domain
VVAMLLTGAGFSRNWGGLLANEAFEYLLGCKEIDGALRDRLWKTKEARKNFEDTLGELQNEYQRQRTAWAVMALERLEGAIRDMFAAMDRNFERDIGFERPTQSLLRNVLASFDAIFTLNQDLLLERHYWPHIRTLVGGKWGACGTPGLRLFGEHRQELAQANLVTPDDEAAYREEKHVQPYFKLHGSSNWRSRDAVPLMVLGGNKTIEIGQHSILKRYFDRFKEMLFTRGVKLLVIGYSFGDWHINKEIERAVEQGGIEIFIIDPMGVDVLDERKPWQSVGGPSPKMQIIAPAIRGASRRPLRDIFSERGLDYRRVVEFLGCNL